MMEEKDIASAYLDGLVEELDAEGLSPKPERPAGFGITILEYAKLKECTEDVARYALDNAVKRKILVKHRMRLGGCGAHAMIYCRPGEWKG
jgi:hypothetical protein